MRREEGEGLELVLDNANLKRIQEIQQIIAVTGQGNGNF